MSRIPQIAGLTVITAALTLLIGLGSGMLGAELEEIGIIQSMRGDNRAYVLLKRRPTKSTYTIIDRGRVMGTVFIEELFVHGREGYPYRALVTVTHLSGSQGVRISAGMVIVLEIEKDDAFVSENRFFMEKRNYRNKILSRHDRREMVLIPGGEAKYGSEQGRADEQYGSTEYIKPFYMDVYEVSNADYYEYIRDTLGPPPISWPGGRFDSETADLPVLATYHEAEAYASWAGKRLPTEQEWEKAARGFAGDEQRLYPPGNILEPHMCNFTEFWKSDQGKDIALSRYSREQQGVLPVTALSDTCISPFGVVNMAGNVPEWTSSWYDSYDDSRKRFPENLKKRFGTLYKVIRGGGWYSDRIDLRVSARIPGGFPNLREDTAAGFRCVKDVTKADLAE